MHRRRAGVGALGVGERAVVGDGGVELAAGPEGEPRRARGRDEQGQREGGQGEGVDTAHGAVEHRHPIDEGRGQRGAGDAADAEGGQRQHGGRGAGGGRGDGDDEERGDGLVGEDADAEAGAVAQRPHGQRQLVVPALRHLAARLRHRQADEPRLAQHAGERRARSRRARAPPSRAGRAAARPQPRRRSQPAAKRIRASAVRRRVPHTAGEMVSTIETPQGLQAPETPAIRPAVQSASDGQHGRPVS